MLENGYSRQLKHVATFLRYVTWLYSYCPIICIYYFVNTAVYLVLVSHIKMNKHNGKHHTNVTINQASVELGWQWIITDEWYKEYAEYMHN